MAKLYFEYGAMGCGKTIQLLQVAFNYEERGHKVCIAKPKVDTKAGTCLSSRIGLERETNFVFAEGENLFERIQRDFSDVSCVLIDEAQFMRPEQVNQLAEVVTKLDVPVMCYGLRLNFRQEGKGFEGATRLLQIADEIREIKTICECGRKATRNARFLDEKLMLDGPDILIDDGKTKIEYRALCAKCLGRYQDKAEKPTD